MTGRIEVLATAYKPGLITTNTGRERFQYSYQFAPGATDLEVGGLVAFELERGNIDTAIKVYALEKGDSPLAVSSASPEVRYQGFEQKNDVRSFRFRAWRIGEENQDLVVSADLALFRKYGITIQEGPALCLRLIEAELQQPCVGQSSVRERKLTAEEIIAHVGRQPARKRRG